MAETARHVNTMEAHHAPNWSRKHHVDGAHDRPSATSGSHGRRPHNATKPNEDRDVLNAVQLLELCVGFAMTS